MPKWSKEEIEDAFINYRKAVRESVATGDWTIWGNLFTEDGSYFEHHFGKFWGRDAITKFMRGVWTRFPAMHMTGYPTSWMVIDEERGWVIVEFLNRMEDIGDGEIYQETCISVLHYAGNGQFKYQEDAYNPARMGAMVNRWLEARERIKAKEVEGKDRVLDRHAESFSQMLVMPEAGTN